MKYAILGPQKGINRITDTEPQNVMEGATVVEITDEQAATVQAGRESDPPVRYFLIEGELVSGEEMRAQREAERLAQREAAAAERLAERLASMTPADKIKAAEAHVLKWFTPLGVSALQDKLLEKKEAGTLDDYPKLVAVYTWMKTIQATALSGGTAFPDPPHTFDEVLAE